MAGRQLSVSWGATTTDVDVDDHRAIVDTIAVSVHAAGDRRWRVGTGEREETVYAVGSGTVVWVWARGRAFRLEVGERATAARTRSGRSASDALSAPMPATVRAVLVAAGDAVRAGDTLLVLEAMKMELPVRAPVDGVVTAIRCQPGDLVQAGVPLVEVA